MRTVRTDILSEIRRSHRPDAGPVHSERTAGKGSHTAGNRSSAEDHCGANRDWLGEPVKLGVRKKIRLVAVDLPKGTSYRRKPRSGGCTPRLTLRRPSGIPPRMISASTCLSFSSSALTRCFAAMRMSAFGHEADMSRQVAHVRFRRDCVAKVSEQLLWNWNLKQSNRCACAFESMFPDRARF